MNEREVRQFIKENLSIALTINEHILFDSKKITIKVELQLKNSDVLLDGDETYLEVISSDTKNFYAMNE